jgi:beta-glucanase (GH16 family)
MYGRFEARIKVARGAGTNTAFWMMPDVKKFEPWPKSGEIDITEQLGREPTITHGTIHYPGHLRRRDQGVYNGDVDLADDFHVYGVEWSRGAFEWYVDGKIFHRTSAPDMARFPFNRRFFLILSQQPGGKHWGGPIDKDTPNPMLMEVDWVRVLKRVPK